MAGVAPASRQAHVTPAIHPAQLTALRALLLLETSGSTARFALAALNATLVMDVVGVEPPPEVLVTLVLQTGLRISVSVVQTPLPVRGKPCELTAHVQMLIKAQRRFRAPVLPHQAGVDGVVVQGRWEYATPGVHTTSTSLQLDTAMKLPVITAGLTSAHLAPTLLVPNALKLLAVLGALLTAAAS